VPQRVDAKTKTARELVLRHAEIGANRLHVDPRRDVDAVGAFVRGPARIGDRVLKAAAYTVGKFTHGFPRPSAYRAIRPPRGKLALSYHTP